MKEFQLECIIENIEMELEFQDFPKRVEAEKKKELQKARIDLEKLRASA